MDKSKRAIPIEFGIWFNHAIELIKIGKSEEAENYFDRCAECCPEAWLGVASEDLKAGMKEQAEKRFMQVIRHATEAKTQSVALNNYGMLLSNNGARKQSEALFRESYKLWKRHDSATNIALSCLYRHDLKQARHWIGKALMIQPGDPQVVFNAALVDLISGDLSNGFKKYEARFKNPVGKTRKLCVFRKEWNGYPEKDKTLLIYAEQGIGDTIQMLRYGPIIKPMVGKLLLATQPGLKALAERQECWDVIYEDLPARIESAQVPEWDIQLPMMSIPRVLHTTLDNVPCGTYLTFPNHSLSIRPDGLRIGFVWAGSLIHTDDLWRSTHIEEWEPLFAIPGAHFYSFQLGPRTVDLVGRPYPIMDLSSELKTYDDSAAYLALMDLAICVDTSLAHLAGALGVETWMLLPYSPDWRWMHDREDSPWYPSMRLFRQTTERDWKPVFETISYEIQHHRKLQERNVCSQSS